MFMYQKHLKVIWTENGLFAQHTHQWHGNWARLMLMRFLYMLDAQNQLVLEVRHCARCCLCCADAHPHLM